MTKLSGTRAVPLNRPRILLVVLLCIVVSGIGLFLWHQQQKVNEVKSVESQFQSTIPSIASLSVSDESEYNDCGWQEAGFTYHYRCLSTLTRALTITDNFSIEQFHNQLTENSWVTDSTINDGLSVKYFSYSKQGYALVVSYYPKLPIPSDSPLAGMQEKITGENGIILTDEQSAALENLPLSKVEIKILRSWTF